MRIGVFSDTHGDISPARRFFHSLAPLDCLFHLGDYAADGDLQAMRTVLQHFGKNKLSEIKRGQRAYYSIDEIINNKTE